MTDAREWEPSYGFTKTDPEALAHALEAVRRRVCAYGPDAQRCDCKYGLTTEQKDRLGSERTGCPELRSAVRLLLHPDDCTDVDSMLLADLRRSGLCDWCDFGHCGPPEYVPCTDDDCACECGGKPKYRARSDTP